MEQLAQSDPPLVTFCKAVVARHSRNWPPSEGVLADEFVESFALELISLEESLKLCQRLGIEVSFAALPPGLHGLNGKHGSRCGIVISTEQTLAFGKLHTLLHEIRELLEYHFSDLGYETVPNHELDSRAESFASLARMSGVTKILAALFGQACKVETNWKRWLSFGGLIFFGLFNSLYIAMHSQLEDAVMRTRQQRKL